MSLDAAPIANNCRHLAVDRPRHLHSEWFAEFRCKVELFPPKLFVVGVRVKAKQEFRVRPRDRLKPDNSLAIDEPKAEVRRPNRNTIQFLYCYFGSERGEL